MNPITNQIGAIFIPVADIERARDWYCELLGLPNDGEIIAGHLYVIPMQGQALGVVLDSKIYSEEHVFKVPAFHFNTDHIENAYAYMKSKNVQLTTVIENGHWFAFKDPDGNELMVCKC